MNKKKLIITLIIILAVIVLISIAIILVKHSNTNIEADNSNNGLSENNTNVADGKFENSVSEIKEEMGLTGEDELYVMAEEYDGRETITINPEIQFNTVLAGVLQQEKPELENLTQLVENRPTESGIWVSNQSREKFLELVNSNTELNYDIDNNGYLTKSSDGNGNSSDEILNNLISGDKTYIIDMSGTCYMVDEVTGEVVEYPFEEMDPYQPYELFEYENSIIYIITSNSSNMLNDEEIFDEFIQSFQYEE